MAELVFVLSDFFSAAPGDAGAGLPRLPLLETLLARSSMTRLAGGWRGWLASRASGEPVRSATLAATVARAWELRPRGAPAAHQVWLATPVHYFAGLDTVHLHPEGLLHLARAEQDTLAADFARVFADSPWQLSALGARELLLWGPVLGASGADPAQFAGSDPSAGLPRGEGAARLRGLGAEIEMWLYEHRLNLERRARGELPVSALWLWGAEASGAAMPPSGAPPRAAQSRPRGLLYGQDTYAEALWRLSGAQRTALPAAFDASLINPQADSIFLYSVLQPQGVIAALVEFEQRWLPGALTAVREGRVSGLRLLLGARGYSLRWLQLARFWRAATPWWEALA